ncbi:hypothetical protein LOK49_LG13G01222 [Camellia lanceoleosa]|uniref:Uncharacterized protein n=1 Tax=Camellia lanceoleosa TaxID=1840588 RepID=A0ACC0FNV3_9ERIC|nr:hypothetical protein LOK49_LG13G01222 [Camellia lanceoleosa]
MRGSQVLRSQPARLTHETLFLFLFLHFCFIGEYVGSSMHYKFILFS